ncbi:hypothetical protein J31TS4_22750 [Paenibacillus sp. J31TS4]|uniref:GrpB family protein n=1 Tax=Paenibacillus sp. J31TS4 TaxID=2807195 RepID=UPI001B0D57FD|nr:GrpB family protein [Paenibacillus sp. J31TS4]GIP38995.1 hypothetical protein J31TS4_22750 [Paenibacillus sp. J31TS4]
MGYEVTLVPYDPDWAVQYEREKEVLRSVLGEAALAIEHIGSTSVEGLCAKPILDLAVGVGELSHADAFVAPLEGIGYIYVPKPEFPARRFFRKGEWRKGTHHLHVYELGSAEWRDQLRFRDALRERRELLREYAELKERLAGLYADDRVQYTEAKAPFIQAVLASPGSI